MSFLSRRESGCHEWFGRFIDKCDEEQQASFFELLLAFAWQRYLLKSLSHMLRFILNAQC